jgi:hypothetical protein
MKIFLQPGLDSDSVDFSDALFVRVPDAVQRSRRCEASSDTLLRRAGTHTHTPWTPDQQRITSCCAASGERVTRIAPKLVAGI